jgi:hypothetical protein
MRASLSPGRPLDRSASRCRRAPFRGLKTTTACTPLAAATVPTARDGPTAGAADPATGTMAEGAGTRGVDAAVGAAVAAGMAQKAAKAAIRMLERPVNSTPTVPHQLEKTG